MNVASASRLAPSVTARLTTPLAAATAAPTARSVGRTTALLVGTLALAACAQRTGAQVAVPARPTAPAVATQRPVVSVADLPLNELPVGTPGSTFAVFMTGDGGWVSLDQGVSAELIAAGIPVVGFNQRAYLWSGKTPDQTGADLARVITAYAAKWHRDSVIVIGYSRGAGIAPFAVNRLPPHLRGAVKMVVLIGAEHTAGFHFRMRDLLSNAPGPDDVPVMPELRRLGGTLLVCFYGEGETDTLCPDLAPPTVVVKMSGGHHLDGAYPEIGKKIVTLVAPQSRK